jgi:uncharacterized protein (DUF433 family)
MSTIDLIRSSRNVLGGTPVFAGTRVPIKNLIDCLEAGDTLDEFLDDFPSVTREQAVQVLKLAKEKLQVYLSTHCVQQ